MSDRKTIKIVLLINGIYLIIIGLMIYFYLKDPNKNYLYLDFKTYDKVVIAKKDLKIGDIIKEEDLDYIEIESSKIIKKDIFENKEDVIGKKVLYPINKMQYIYRNYLLSKKDWYENGTLFPIEVDMIETLNNVVKIGDYVDINVALNNSSGVHGKYLNYSRVITKVIVEDIRDSKFNSIKNQKKKETQINNTGFIPKYIYVKLNDKQIDYYLDAKKQGKIFIEIYTDRTANPNIVNYKLTNKTNQ